MSIAQRVQSCLVEDLRDQPHVFEDHNLGALADRNSCRLLPSMLQRIETEVSEFCDILMRCPDAKNPTRVLRSAGVGVGGVEVVVQQAVTLCHNPIVFASCQQYRQLLVPAKKSGRSDIPCPLPWSQQSPQGT
jgi:hypothetical protein